MPEMAHRIADDLRRDFPVFYDESGAIGRRYRRQDEVGTPFCITVDGESIGDGTVTVRDRDSLQQERVPADRLRAYVAERSATEEPRRHAAPRAPRNGRGSDRSEAMSRPTAVITGASRGIGRAIALRLAATHDIVAVARSADDLASLAREMSEAGGRPLYDAAAGPGRRRCDRASAGRGARRTCW